MPIAGPQSACFSLASVKWNVLFRLPEQLPGALGVCLTSKLKIPRAEQNNAMQLRLLSKIIALGALSE